MAIGGFAHTLYDFTVLRFIVELAIKPVSGTLRIHSGRHLMLEAGEGKAHIPTSLNKWMNFDENADIDRITQKIKEWISYFKIYRKKHISNYTDLCGKRSELENTVKKKVGVRMRHGRLYSEFISSLIEEIDSDSVVDDYLRIEDQVRKNRVKLYIRRYKIKIREFLDEPIIPAHNQINPEFRRLVKKILVVGNVPHNNFVDINPGNYEYLFVEPETQRKIVRMGIHKILKGHAINIQYKDEKLDPENQNSYSKENWDDLVNSFRKDILLSAQNANKLVNALNYPVDVVSTFKWAADTTPQILFSEERGKTLSVGGEEQLTCKTSIDKLIDAISI